MRDYNELDSIYVAGERLYYDDDERTIEDGLRYLQKDLQREEARVFFIAARETGEAQFEDDKEHQYTIHHERGKYVLTVR